MCLEHHSERLKTSGLFSWSRTCSMAMTVSRPCIHCNLGITWLHLDKADPEGAPIHKRRHGHRRAQSPLMKPRAAKLKLVSKSLHEPAAASASIPLTHCNVLMPILFGAESQDKVGRHHRQDLCFTKAPTLVVVSLRKPG